MKAFLIAITALAVFATSASAQVGGRRGGGEEKGPHANPAGPAPVDEKAYKAAMERIPEAKQKYDPWGGVAPAQTPAAPAKKKQP